MFRLLGLFLVLAFPAFALDVTEEDVTTVQRALSGDGYFDGEIDGKTGNALSAAIRVYQADWQLDETGLVDAELVARLAREHADSKSRIQRAANVECDLENPYPQARETIVYEGACPDGVASGQGKVVWKYMRRGQWRQSDYEGGFLQGRPHGEGVLNHDTGNRYEGSFINGEYDGFGIRTWSIGTIYKGQWREGRQQGPGLAIWPNGNIYDGEWREGKHDGRGIKIWHSGDYYEGEWQAGKPHGTGVFVTTDGARDEGDWKNGCWIGNGRKRWISTSKEACGF